MSLQELGLAHVKRIEELIILEDKRDFQAQQLNEILWGLIEEYVSSIRDIWEKEQEPIQYETEDDETLVKFRNKRIRFYYEIDRCSKKLILKMDSSKRKETIAAIHPNTEQWCVLSEGHYISIENLAEVLENVFNDLVSEVIKEYENKFTPFGLEE